MAGEGSSGRNGFVDDLIRVDLKITASDVGLTVSWSDGRNRIQPVSVSNRVWNEEKVVALAEVCFTEHDEAQTLGLALGQILFPGNVRDRLVELRATAHLVIALTIEPVDGAEGVAATLRSLPWELASVGADIFAREGVDLVRLPHPHGVPRDVPAGPAPRILVFEGVRRGLRKGKVSELLRAELPEGAVEVVEGSRRNDLVGHLDVASEPYDLLVFDGHGSPTGLLVGRPASTTTDWLHGRELALVIRDKVRSVALIACSSGGAGADPERRGGVAEELAADGIPCLAFQNELGDSDESYTDETSAVIRALAESIAGGRTLREATAAVRKSLDDLKTGGVATFARPVLWQPSSDDVWIRGPEPARRQHVIGGDQTSGRLPGLTKVLVVLSVLLLIGAFALNSWGFSRNEDAEATPSSPETSGRVSVDNLDPNEPLATGDVEGAPATTEHEPLERYQDELEVLGFLDDPEAAHREAAAVLEDEPDNWEALTLLSLSSTDPDQAFDAADEALDRSRTDEDKALARALRARATVLHDDADLASARADMSVALGLDEESPDIRLIGSRVLAADGRFPEALASVDAAIELGLPEATAFSTRSWLLVQQDELPLAIEAAERALDAGASAEILISVAAAQQRSGDHPTALETIDRVLASVPDSGTAIHRRAELIAETDGDERAAAWLESYLQGIDAAPEEMKYPYSLLGDLLRLLDRAKEAVPVLDRSIEGFEADETLDEGGLASARYRRGLALRSIGEYDDAIDDIEAAEELSPDWEWPTNTRGDILLDDLDKPDEAADAYSEALSPDATYYPQVGLGRALQADGDVDGARKAYERARELDPSAAYPRLRLATLEDDPAEALRLTREAFDLQPDDPEARVLLGRYLRADGDLAGARSHLDSELSDHPDDVQLLAERSYLAYEEGEQAATGPDRAAHFLAGLGFLDRALELAAADERTELDWLPNHRGALLNQLSRAREAADEFATAMQLQPEWVVPRANLAYMAIYEMDDPQAAVPILEPVVTRDDLTAELRTYEEGAAAYVHQYLGMGYLAAGQPGKAKAQFQLDLADELHPKNAWSIVGLAVARRDEATAKDGSTAELEPVLLTRARRFDALDTASALVSFGEDHELVISTLRAALDEKPSDLDVHARLLEELRNPSTGEPDEDAALQLIRTQLERDHDVDHLRRYRVDEADVLVGLAYDEPGDSTVRSQLLAEADAAYRAAEAAPGTWPTNAAISASRIYYVTGAQGDDGRARAELTDLFGRLPADDDALDQVAEHLSWTLLNRFGDEGRTALFELLRSRADDSVEVRVELIVQLLDHAAWNLASGTRTQGEALVTEANAAAERASQIHPGYSQPHALRCRAHLLLGDFANAADACDAALDRYGKSFEEAGWHGVDLASAATDAVEAADNESAMQIVRIIARTRPDDPDAVASDLIAVATSFRQADQLTEAQEVLRIAHEQAEPLS